MVRRPLLSTALLLAACGPQTVPLEPSAEAAVELDAYVDRSQTPVGKRVMLRVVLDHRREIEVELRAPTEALDALPVVKSGREESRSLPGRVRWTQWYSLEPNRAGVLVVPAFEARFQDANGQPQSVATEAVYIDVTAEPKADPDSEIRDIWGPSPLTEFPWGWIVAGAAALLLLAVALWRFVRGRAETPPPALSPEERVRQQLDRLATFDVSSQEGARLFCFELTEALKRYLESLCDLNASDLTTQEIAVAIQTTWLAHEQRVELIQVLRAADRVKFAGDRADVAELRRLHQSALRFVDRAFPDPTVHADANEERAS